MRCRRWWSWQASSDVAVQRVLHHREALDEFGDAGVQAHRSLEPGALDLLVRHDVVALVRVFADRRIEEHELRQLLLDALAKTIRPSLATRVGFRYVNRLESPDDLISLGELVHSELIGILANQLKGQVEQTISQAQCKTAEGLLLVRWGMLPPGVSHDPDMAPPANSPSWMLDIDSITTEGMSKSAFEPEKLTSLVDSMANRAYSFFRWSITDRFLDRFGASQQ